MLIKASCISAGIAITSSIVIARLKTRIAIDANADARGKRSSVAGAFSNL